MTDTPNKEGCGCMPWGYMNGVDRSACRDTAQKAQIIEQANEIARLLNEAADEHCKGAEQWTRNQRLETEIEHLRAEVARSDNEFNGLNDEYNALQRELQDAKAEVAAMEKCGLAKDVGGTWKNVLATARRNEGDKRNDVLARALGRALSDLHDHKIITLDEMARALTDTKGETR